MLMANAYQSNDNMRKIVTSADNLTEPGFPKGQWVTSVHWMIRSIGIPTYNQTCIHRLD